MSSRARLPDESGSVVRDGVPVAYDVYGAGDTTVVLMPAWSLVHSRMWKGQVPYLARHYRVVTFDGRGNGRSGRPRGAAAYADAEFVADTVAVLDATGTRSAVLVSVSAGARWAVQLAATHPERVTGILALDPAIVFHEEKRQAQLRAWRAPFARSTWRSTYNRQYWLAGGIDDFRRAFTAQVFPEPHSSKQVEDSLEWSSGVPPELLVDTTDGRLGVEGAAFEPFEPLCERLRCPVSVIHGGRDEIAPPAVGEQLAQLTGGSFTLLAGSGHAPNGRDPVAVNLMIRDFVDRVAPPAPLAPSPAGTGLVVGPPPEGTTPVVGPPDGRTPVAGPASPTVRVWTRARDRQRRALYVSSPIGLGHARRDLAIAAQLRAHHPDLRIEWLAQPPVTGVLADAGETVHPASAWLASESAHIESEAAEHDLHAFQAYRRMDEILVNNFHVFHDVVSEQHYDLVIGDEAWDIDYFLHENPELKRYTYAWLTDFVGMLPMPDGGEREAALCADHNAEMLAQRSRYRRLRDRSIFVGNPEDVVPAPFGPGLPPIRAWTEEQFDFAGYVTGFEPVGPDSVASLRASLRLQPDDKLCVVAVGGSGVGAPLLRRVLDAVPIARRLRPDLRVLMVTGPRIAPASLPRRRGVRVRGYLPRLYEHLAACDVAVVQGGLTTCMELAAAGKPFLYIPLRHHFEQNIHVRHRLERYRAGRHLDYADAQDPHVLAEAIVKELAAEPRSRPVERDGAARAGALLADLL